MQVYELIEEHEGNLVEPKLVGEAVEFGDGRVVVRYLGVTMQYADIEGAMEIHADKCIFRCVYASE